MYPYGPSTSDATYTKLAVSRFSTVSNVKLKGKWRLFSFPLDSTFYVSRNFHLLIQKYRRFLWFRVNFEKMHRVTTLDYFYHDLLRFYLHLYLSEEFLQQRQLKFLRFLSQNSFWMVSIVNKA